MTTLPCFGEDKLCQIFGMSREELQRQMAVGPDGLSLFEREMHRRDMEAFTAYGDTLYERAWVENLAWDARDAAMTAKAQPWLDDLEEEKWAPWDSEEDYERYMLNECLLSERGPSGHGAWV